MTSPEPLHPGEFYHIYNRGNNRENIFLAQDNYQYFLDLYRKHIEPVAGTYAYCLLRNHFHLLVCIYLTEDLDTIGGNHSPHRRQPNASQAFGNLFNAYSKAFNKTNGRTGSLFEHPYQRIRVKSESHFSSLITYIHMNPQRHGFVSDFRKWPYSSYQGLISNRPTLLKRDAVIGWFGGVDGLEKAHSHVGEEDGIDYLVEKDR